VIRLSATEIARIVNGKVHGDESTVVEAGVETDSRRIEPGFLFVAKPGEETDGHLFVGAAKESGAVAALVERIVEADLTQILVADVVVAIGMLATEVLDRLRQDGDLTVIGVTGSNGKPPPKTCCEPPSKSWRDNCSARIIQQ